MSASSYQRRPLDARVSDRFPAKCPLHSTTEDQTDTNMHNEATYPPPIVGSVSSWPSARSATEARRNDLSLGLSCIVGAEVALREERPMLRPPGRASAVGMAT